MKQPTIKMVITDLDGTLLNSEGRVSKEDYKTMEMLGEKGIVRVIASGRSIFSLRKALPGHFPIDYFICSCGGGVFQWKTQELIFSQQLSKEIVSKAAKLLISENVNFMALCPIPENHKFVYFTPNHIYSDFQRRIDRYPEYCRKINVKNENYLEASQIIVIIPNDENLFTHLKNKLTSSVEGIRIIRSTSPLDLTSIWLEIFPKGVSKGETAQWLWNKIGISQSETLGIGNDYNDIDLLNATAHSFWVENTPDELKKQHNIAKSNNESGFSSAVKKLI